MDRHSPAPCLHLDGPKAGPCRPLSKLLRSACLRIHAVPGAATHGNAFCFFNDVNSWLSRHQDTVEELPYFSQSASRAYYWKGRRRRRKKPYKVFGTVVSIAELALHLVLASVALGILQNCPLARHFSTTFQCLNAAAHPQFARPPLASTRSCKQTGEQLVLFLNLFSSHLWKPPLPTVK